MYRHIRNSSLEAWCVRIPLTTVISANVIIVETELYSNKSTLLKPLKLEWNVAVMKMWRGSSDLVSVRRRNSLGFWQKSFTEVLCLSSMNASFQFYHHFCYTHLQKGSKLLLLKNANLDLKNPSYAMMQFDFSQNMTCEWQDAQMSTHWHKTQITIFTCVIWHKANKFFKVKVRLSFWPWA